MADIVLATLNAKYPHCALGLRYLLANLEELEPRAVLLEGDIHQQPLEVVEQILSHDPRIVGCGVYIWNVREMLRVVSLLKRVRPEVCVVLGGPEVSHETEDQEIVRLADHVIAGEADLEFARVCRLLLGGQPPAEKLIVAVPPELGALRLPYRLYRDEDVAHRVVYVESSRGCPYHCEFCLSSLDVPVRVFPLERLFAELGHLLERGLRRFKFVDRTFNVDIGRSGAVLDFFLDRWVPGLFLHFEMIPDHLPAVLRERVRRFPAGSLQFEVGLQTLDPTVGERIRRRQDLAVAEENLRFLREETGVHVHADLILGLPGESLEGFARGFDRLVGWDPQEIQVGLLKRLRGTTLGRHDAEWGMVYRADPPYDLLCNRLIDFPTMQRLRRFARYWDLVANSGNFVETAPRLWSEVSSPFAAFLAWSDWLYGKLGRQHAIPLDGLAEQLFGYLVDACGQPAERVAESLTRDYRRAGRREIPEFLRRFGPAHPTERRAPQSNSPPRRQQRHLDDRGGPTSR